MKNKFYKVLLAALLLLVFIPAAVMAEDAPPADQLASDLTNSYGEWRSRTRSDEFTITYTDYSISAGDGYVRISGTTESNIMADSLGVNMIVEQWSGSKWVVYDNFYFVAYETASELCDISPRFFGSIARGQVTPSINTLEKICIGFGKMPNELLGFSTEKEELSYRMDMPVVHYKRFQYDIVCPVCPRCMKCLDREYQMFCDNCGQKLNWDMYTHATLADQCKKEFG